MAVGFGLVILTAVAAKIFLDQKKKKKITLVEPNTKYALKLIDKVNLSHDTRRFRFELPSSEHVLGLPTGQVIIFTISPIFIYFARWYKYEISRLNF